jgi:hypothetical protein
VAIILQLLRPSTALLLGKEEQKKAWQEQSHKNVLAKTACLNFGMRKLSVTSVASSWVDLCRPK